MGKEEGVAAASPAIKEEAASVVAPQKDNGSSSVSATTDASKKKQEEGEKKPMVTVRELFSFARTRKSRLCIAGAFVFACISGVTFPGACVPVPKIAAKAGERAPFLRCT